jgi:hypothetical protein
MRGAKADFGEGKENCRSLGFARDDKKGRVDARRERLLKGRVLVRGQVEEAGGYQRKTCFRPMRETLFL